MSAQLLLRSMAVAIAILAAFDPAITSQRYNRPVVAVVAGSMQGDSALAEAVVRGLDNRFAIVRAPFSSAAATVLVGSRLRDDAAAIAAPAFAVLPSVERGVVVADVSAPPRAQLDARAGVTTTLHVKGHAGGRLVLTLLANGMPVDKTELLVATDNDTLQAPLHFVPVASGGVSLRVMAQVEGARDSAVADLALDVIADRWSVLFVDRRPSWMSTFVRRAVETDPRFVVTSRVVTSRNVSVDAGQPPASLDDFATVAQYDVVVAGAPESLTDRDVSGLEEYLRRRGGQVVLLLDQNERGPYTRLLGVAKWDAQSSRLITKVTAHSIASDTVLASELMWPSVLPPGATALGVASVTATNQPAGAQPIIWRSATGAGGVVVSGALDAWRFRDSLSGAFDNFWRGTIAQAAAQATEPMEIELTSRVTSPGTHGSLRVTLRDITLLNDAAIATGAAVGAQSSGLPATSISATLVGGGDSVQVRLWPEGQPGVFHGSFRTPVKPGEYRVLVHSDGVTGSAHLSVLADLSLASAAQHDLVSSWTASRLGATFTEDRLSELLPALQSAIEREKQAERWHPMRSAWWIIPFTLLLGAEWWLRRRSGLA